MLCNKYYKVKRLKISKIESSIYLFSQNSSINVSLFYDMKSVDKPLKAATRS